MSDEHLSQNEADDITVDFDDNGNDDVADTSSGPSGMETEPTPEEAEEVAAEDQLHNDLDHLQAELESVNDRHLRLAAEFNNYRKRVDQEMAESWIRAQGDLVRRLLEVLDDLQRVSELDAENSTIQSVIEGIDLVERKFLRVMNEIGLEILDPAGEAFDPETMEAMMSVPADSDEHDDTVGQVLQKGYFLKGHLIRPARVSVRKRD